MGRSAPNSNKPPSSDPPGTSGSGSGTGKNKGKDKGKQRKRGGQPGHKGKHRQLLPEDQVNDFVDFYPKECEGCFCKLPEILDPHASRFKHKKRSSPASVYLNPTKATLEMLLAPCRRQGHQALTTGAKRDLPTRPARSRNLAEPVGNADEG